MKSFETNDLNFKKSSQKEIHIKARIEYPSIYPKRFEVPDEKVAWEINYPEYNPEYFVAPKVLENDYSKKENGWAEPEEIPKNKISEWINKKINIDSNGRPLNPYGRTGICRRGLLCRWGEKPAADPIITRINPHNK